MDVVIFLGYVAVFLFFVCRRSRRLLHFFQQEQYLHGAYRQWWWHRRAWDKKVSAGLLLAACWAAAGHFKGPGLIAVAVLGYVAFREPNPLKNAKIKLNMTERAWRLTGVYALLVVLTWFTLLQLLPVFSPAFFVLQIVFVQSLFLMWLLADRMLQPTERRIQQKFYREAQAQLERHHPYIVGITGSYGKTSTKAILGQLMTLSLGPTFWPVKGINSLMGVTREIRERLIADYSYAVIEMGAFHKGSIEKLCRLTPPQAGIITAAAWMHLSRFGGAEALIQAKSELARALPKDGVLVCNGDEPGARRIAREHPTEKTFLYGLNEPHEGLDSFATEMQVDENGTRFVWHWQGKPYAVHTQLLGLPAVSNLLAALTLVCALGANPDVCVAAVRHLESVDYRLRLQKDGGITWLNDAYNSNPAGFSAALEVLKALPAQRRVLITPGIIDIGDQQYPENHRVAAHAARLVDWIIVVGTENRLAWKEGVGAHTQVDYVDHRSEAFSLYQTHSKPGDVILLENDLTDVYEAELGF